MMINRIVNNHHFLPAIRDYTDRLVEGFFKATICCLKEYNSGGCGPPGHNASR